MEPSDLYFTPRDTHPWVTASRQAVRFGVSIAGTVREFNSMGIQLPRVKARQEAMVETIQILRGLWSGKRVSFDGDHFSARTGGDFLPPVQQPRVPILLAGGGEKVTLRQ